MTMISHEDTTCPKHIVNFAEISIKGFSAQSEHPVQYYNPLPEGKGYEYFVFGSLKTPRPKSRIKTDTWGNPLPTHDYCFYTVVIHETAEGMTVNRHYRGVYA